MKSLKELVSVNKPLAIVQYFEWLVTAPSETNKVYEMMTTDEDGDFISTILESDDINYLKKNIEKFDIKHDTKDGRVYEFNDFKKKAQSLNL